MELKVIHEGLERSVSGVTENTTCLDIIYALARATKQRGGFVMVEKYRNVERRLAPTDRPLETLKKWKEHAVNVTFQILRVNETDEMAVFKQLDDSIDMSQSFGTLRLPSTSSMVTTMTGRNAAAATTVSSAVGQLESGQQRSTSSLPAYPSIGVNTIGRQSRRPPPPDYKMVMEQKNSMKMSQAANSDDVLDIQKLDITKLGDDVTKEELAEYFAYEEELRQLLLQQKNLRQILQPMKSANWPQKYQQEVKRSHRLKASLEATIEAIDKTKGDIEHVERMEKELLQKIEFFEKEDAENENVLETTIDMNSSNGKGTPQKASA